MSASIRQKLYDLKTQRENYIRAAEMALEADNQEEYRANIDQAKALNEKLDELQADLVEAERYDKLTPPGSMLQAGAKPPQTTAFKTVDDLRGMTPAEINAHWDEIYAQLKPRK